MDDMDYCLAYIEKKFHPKENPLHNCNIGNVPGFLQCQSSPDYVYGVLMAIPNQRLTKFNKSAQKTTPRYTKSICQVPFSSIFLFYPFLKLSDLSDDPNANCFDHLRSTLSA